MAPPFVVDAAMLTEFQTCRRKFLLSRRWRPRRWFPKALFDSCLRRGILELSLGNPVQDVVIASTTMYMNTAANPGLDISGVDPYTVATDYCAMLETILQALSRRPMRKLEPVPTKPIDNHMEWSFLSFADEEGTLHRTITVDGFDDDRLSQELHSWYVFGDVCVSRKPMKLHLIDIGRQRNGRRHSPWARAWEHEYIHGRIKFQRKSGRALEGKAWKPIWLADSTTYDAIAWVDVMEQEQAVESLMRDVEVSVPAIPHLRIGMRDIKTEADQITQWMTAVHNPMAVPMSRNACDVPFSCPYQAICYSPVEHVEIESLGLFKPRKSAL